MKPRLNISDMLDTKLGHNAFMYIDGGHNGGPPPNSLDALSEVIITRLCILKDNRWFV